MANSPTPARIDSATSVLIADNTRMGGQLLAEALRRRSRGFKVLGRFDGACELLTAVKDRNPRVALISANLGDGPLSGFKLARQLRTSYPGTRVVMLLDDSRRDLVIEAFRAGARGVFCRADSFTSLCKCISSVDHGQVWANSTELGFVLEALAEGAPFNLVDAKGAALLSKREEDVIRCVANGLTNREIAAQLKLSEHTVKNYLLRIFDKLGVSSRVETILYAFGQRASAQALTVMPERSWPSPGDEVATFSWYQRAAEQGFEAAQFVLGLMYRDGYGVAVDKIAAYMWFLLAEQTSSHMRIEVKEAKDRLKRMMRSDEIAEARRRAANWLNQHAARGRRLPSTRWGDEKKALPITSSAVG